MSKKQPIGIELPKETIEALLNGASKFIMPIKSQGLTKLEVNEYSELTCSNCGHIADNVPKHICLHCEGLMCNENAPLQIGDEFYVQEEFIMGCADVEEQLDYRVFYKNETPDLEWCDAPEDEPYPAPFNEASQMTPDQSRINGKVVNAESKRVQDIGFMDYYLFGMQWGRDCAFFNKDNVFNQNEYPCYDLECFKDFLKKININYDENPYVLLNTVELQA